MSIVDIVAQPQSVAVIVLVLTLLAVVHRWLTTSSSTLPPGPPKESWIFGNSIPTVFAYRKFEEWTKIYGPIFSLRQGLNTIIIIGRYQAAVEIMEREGAALADRPVSISAGETLSGGMRLLLTPAGERFKKMRKALHAHLQPKVIPMYGPVLMRNARRHILDILDNPDIHQQHAIRYSASVVMALAYGKDAGGHDDPDVVAVNRCLVRLGVALRPGLWQVDIYPFLRYVPGYLKELQDGHAEELGLFKKHLFMVKQQMERGESVPECFGKYLLERQASLALTDDETAYLAGSMFGAGSDTTASAISVGVLAAACYPEAQAKVQEELDNVIGRERAPTFADQDSLPQLNAFVLETFRWRPVTAGGFAHKATKDIIWKDYVIPKGTTVIGNVWSVNRDPAVFPDPESFNPQRWLTKEGTIRDDLKAFTFGFGRRVCPGQYMASASVFVNTALIQWAFRIKKDPLHPIDELSFTESANAHPSKFKVFFEPRAARTKEGIRELMDEYGVL
ncbi:O-methylsterigmatocystin oxidoreductase [Hypsizygus marmoreus]|uniref:O-methylsterigmatocystin oxidoreductase n=1 Tax=Hypsizygus marmoreus TaxID=39966 RepID=A0A369K1F3_HYPMA|nr:O-methylsterigmatocystin oxidoreductase [Hypsizygus marmoreus]